jgi:peptidoglycan/LPS O-acetylase OafA/YrhL
MSSVLGAAGLPAATATEGRLVPTSVAATSDGVSHGRRDLPSLTGLRWVAAFLVFVFHGASWSLPTSRWWHLGQFGFVGVSFFFVLSGVVLTWSTRPGQAPGQFYWRRFARIYPSHFVTATVAIVLYLYVMPPHKDLWAGLLALALLHAWVPVPGVYSAANGVSWSLSCEALFYALFPGLFALLSRWSPRRRVGFVAVVLGTCSAVAITVSVVVAGGRYDVAGYMSPPVRAGEFVLGIVIGLALREGWVPRIRVGVAWAATVAAVGVCLGLGALRGWPVPRGVADVVAVGPLTLVLVAYAGRDLTGRRTVMARPWAVYLGQLSFAFYLVHQLVLDLLLKKVVPFTDASVSSAVWRLALALGISVLAAMAVHHGVELRAQRLLTRRRPRTASIPVPYPDEPRAREIARAAS